MLVKLSTSKTVSETAAALQAAVQANHFGVMQVHNLCPLCFAKMPSGPKMARFSFATAGIRSLHSTKSFCQDPEGFFWAEMWARLRRGYA